VDEPHGPWDRSIDVDGPTPWFETSNLAFPREPFLAAGGFPVLDLLPRRRAPRGFGEDVVLGRRLARALPTRWVSDAVVWHRWIPGTFTDCLAGQWRVVGFPLLVRELPELRDALWVKTFLTPRTAAFWSLLAGAGVATATGRRSALLAGLPWLAQAWPDARRRARLRAPLRLAQVAMADAVTVLALVEGSARARRVVL
jgi:hypothetical protein